MANQRKEGHQLVGFWAHPEFLAAIDLARGYQTRSQFVRDSLILRLKEAGVDIDESVSVAPDRVKKSPSDQDIRTRTARKPARPNPPQFAHDELVRAGMDVTAPDLDEAPVRVLPDDRRQDSKPKGVTRPSAGAHLTSEERALAESAISEKTLPGMPEAVRDRLKLGVVAMRRLARDEGSAKTGKAASTSGSKARPSRGSAPSTSR